MLNLDEDLPEIHSDSDALRQVFNNLILNAIQAMSQQDQAELVIKSEKKHDQTDDFIQINIIDNGPGIKQDLIDTLFEPYVSSKQKGSGLGLAIVKRITENLGGIVWAQENKPKGTQFIIKFPIEI